jgi:predicted esterase
MMRTGRLPALLAALALAAALGATATGAAAPPASPWAAAAPAAPAPELPRGRLIEKVVCSASPDQTYALYLPKSYRPDRTWPILFAFDARGKALVPAEAFQSAAETYGWIVASSYNTASDGPMEPNFTAMRAMWADTHARLAIDDKRVYAAGFSGTVRFACLLGLSAPGSIAGVIGASAGFPTSVAPKADNPFPFFGTAGDRDFNYYEMMSLDRQLAALHVRHRIEVFDGSHQWPPAALAGQAIAWMEVAAMRAGTREKAPAVVETLWTADAERARAQEAAGKLWDAHHTWEAMAEGYAGLHDVSSAEKRAAEIVAGEAYKKQAKERQDRDIRDSKLLAEAPQILAQANPGNSAVTVSQIAAQLKIPELRKRAESADADEKLAAKRVLNTLIVQTAYYLPQMFVEKKEYDRAVFMLSLATEIRPDEPTLWVDIAAAHARKGKAGHKKALEALRKAVDKGLSDPDALEKEPAFAELRQDAGYREILAQVTQRKQAPAKTGGGEE